MLKNYTTGRQAFSNWQCDVHDLVLFTFGDLAGLGGIFESLQCNELSAKDRFVEVEGFFGVTGKVEIRIDCCHGFLSCNYC